MTEFILGAIAVLFGVFAGATIATPSKPNKEDK
jgi:hypothetical protein